MKKIVVIAAISIAFLGVLATSASAAGRGNGGAGVRGGHWAGQSRGGGWHGGGARGGHWAAQSRGGWHGGRGWHGGGGHGHGGHGHGWHGHGWRGHGWWGPRVGVGWPWYGYGYGYWPYAAYPYYGGYYGASVAYDSPTVVYTEPSATSVAPEVQREVVYPHGRYVLQGDGVNSAYQWVWIPNPPSQPPPEQR